MTTTEPEANGGRAAEGDAETVSDAAEAAPEAAEEPPRLCEDWRESVYEGHEWTMRLPTGHRVSVRRVSEQYHAVDEKRGGHRREMRIYRGLILDNAGTEIANYWMSNDQVAARAFMADRAYRHAYGLANYVLMTRST